MHKSLLSIGSNLGNRLFYIETAILEIQNLKQTKMIAKSSILETKALEVTDQPDFLNCVIAIETKLPPLKLLFELQNIELKIGRVKRYDKGPREIDIDILTFDDLERKHKQLILPHHSIRTRPFIKQLIQELE